MKLPLAPKDFEGQTITVQTAGVRSGPKLLINGQPAFTLNAGVIYFVLAALVSIALGEI